MTKDDLDKLEALAKPLKNRPWTFTPGDAECDCGEGCDSQDQCPNWVLRESCSIDGIFTVDCGDYYGIDNQAGELIAACSPTAIKALTARIRELEGENKKLRNALAFEGEMTLEER